MRKSWSSIGVGLLLLVSSSGLWAADKMKIKFATAVKLFPVFYLPVLAAEERGYWKEEDLEVEWVPFAGGHPMNQAIAAGAIKTGFIHPGSQLPVVAGGVPVVLTARLYDNEDYFIWVPADSRIKKPQDLKGARIGVSSLGGTAHAWGRAVAKQLGLEKEIKFVSTGGIAPTQAALKTGAIDGSMNPLTIMVNFKLKGELREILSVDDFRPKEWAGYSTFAVADLIKKNPAAVKSIVKAVFKSITYLEKNPPWAIEKMKEISGYSQEAAELVVATLDFAKVCPIDAKGLENVKNFMVEYKIVAPERLPPLDKLYSKEFCT